MKCVLEGFIKYKVVTVCGLWKANWDKWDKNKAVINYGLPAAKAPGFISPTLKIPHAEKEER